MSPSPDLLALGRKTFAIHKRMLQLADALASLRVEHPDHPWDQAAPLIDSARRSTGAALRTVHTLLTAQQPSSADIDKVERDLRLALLLLPAPAQQFVLETA